MRILVTGGSGFIGRNIASHLVSLGHEVLTTYRPNEQPVVRGTTIFGPDFHELNPQSLDGLDAVLHQAANNDPQSKDLIGIHKTNVVQTALLMESAYEAGCRKFIYASSASVYGDQHPPFCEETTVLYPATPYAYSKVALEEYVHAFHRLRPDMRCLGLRYSNVYGPGEQHKGSRASMIYQMIKSIKEGRPPKLFKYGHQRRDWVYIEDVVQANVLALTATDFQDSVFNVGSGGYCCFLTLMETINKVLGTNVEPVWIDNPYESTYQEYTHCDISLAKAILGYEPKFDFVRGIENYVENWK